MALYDYRWATGHGVALGSLVNVEDDLLPYTRGVRIAPKTQPVDPFPVRVKTLDGLVHGDGAINHAWTFAALPIAALDYIIDTYLVTTGSQVVSKAITIYTRRHDRLTYTRYNAYLVLPQPDADYTYNKKLVFNLRLTFSNLVAL